jgi:hypothetical protein
MADLHSFLLLVDGILMRKRWCTGIVLVAAALLSACGANMSGEPSIVDEVQIRPTSTPLASATPAASSTPAASAESAAPAETQAVSTPAESSTSGEAAAQDPHRITLGRELFWRPACITAAGWDRAGLFDHRGRIRASGLEQG